MNKGFGLIGILIAVGILAVVAGGGYYYAQNTQVGENRIYMANSVEECSAIDYVCEKDWDYFNDETGCGCEIPEENKEYEIFFFDENSTSSNNDTRSWVEIQGSEIPVTVNGSELIYKPGGFGMIIESSWEEIATEKINFPDYLGNDPKFAFKKKDTNCIFAYVRNPETSWDGYKQISFATRVFTTENEQLDASWYKRVEDLSDSFEFRWEGRQSLPGEVRINPYRYSLPSDSINFFKKPDCVNCYDSFILFSDDGGVSDSCDIEFSSMLKSIFDNFEYTTIDINSNGILYISSEFGIGKPKTFLSAFDNYPFVRVVKDMEIYYDETPVIYNGKFYYSSEEGLYTLDFISGKTSPVFNLDPNEYIKDFYFYDNKIFILSQRCKTGKGVNASGCIQKLYEYDSLSKEIDLLSEKLPPVSWFKPLRIIGIDSEKNILLLYYSSGDAGCSGQGVYWFDFASKKIVEGGSAGRCEGDDISKDIEFDKLSKTYKSFLDNFELVDYIEIHNGQILFLGKYSTDLSPGGNLKYQK